MNTLCRKKAVMKISKIENTKEKQSDMLNKNTLYICVTSSKYFNIYSNSAWDKKKIFLCRIINIYISHMSDIVKIYMILSFRDVSKSQILVYLRYEK